MQELEYINCNLCGQNDAEFICSYDRIKIVKCKNCGLIYRNPRIKGSLIREFYNTDYYGNYNYQELEDRIAEARMPFFKKVLSHLGNKTNGRRILDIGCGQGHFLKLAKDRGWQVEGLELAQSACDYAKQKFDIDIVNKSLNEANFKDNYFDVITLWNVLDHLLNPLETLKEIKRILKPGGILVIRVPNVNFHLFLHQLFLLFSFIVRNRRLRDPSVIVNYGFSNKTIKEMLNKVGFNKVRVYNSPLSFGDPYLSFQFSTDFAINIFKSSLFALSQSIYYLSFGKYTMGSSLLVWARK